MLEINHGVVREVYHSRAVVREEGPSLWNSLSYNLRALPQDLSDLFIN